jgi:4-hydroxybenzoate polyprenyltransferase
MKPKHYIKNGLIFVSLFFTGSLFDLYLLGVVIAGFCSFSIMSSAVYVFNDIRDVMSDRLHEKKRLRPIAAGKIKTSTAFFIAVFLIIFAFVLHLMIGVLWGYGTLYLLLYLVLNIVYSAGLKKVPLLDIALLVSGFLLRVLYGAAIIGDTVSYWVYLTVMAASFYLGLGKRRNELLCLGDGAEQTRGVLKFYTYNFLDKNMYMSMSLGIVFYALWSVDSNTVARYGSPNLVWTVPLVLLIAMKYSLDIEKGDFGDPVEVILNDKILLSITGVYVFLMLGIIYTSF